MLPKRWSMRIPILLNIFFITSLATTSAQLISRDHWDVEACGKPSKYAGLIVDGSDIRHGQFPWIVAFNQTKKLKLNATSSFFCGGTLVSLQHVITAAHCMQPKYRQSDFDIFEPSDVIALFGAHDLSYVNEPGRLSLSPQEIHIHNEWNYQNLSYDADIALLVFESGKIRSSHLIQPICLWNSREVLVETEGTVVGWGKSRDVYKNHENVPKKIQVPMFTNEKCFLETYELARISSFRTFCAGFRNGTGVCVGDSGSGFFVKNGDSYYLRGIVSSSLIGPLGCDVTKYAIYTNVLKFTNWIAYTMREGVQPNETAESQDLPFEPTQENISNWRSKARDKTARRISDIKCEEYKNIIATSVEGDKDAFDEDFKTFDCGAVGLSGLIVGGTKATPGEFPHMAAIGWLEQGKIDFKAAGSLISEKYVLSCAHVLSDSRNTPSSVRLGALDISIRNESDTTIDIDIKRFVIHADHNELTYQNDIALIELNRSVFFHKIFIRPACLQQKNYNGEALIATGWGKTGTFSASSDFLLKVVLKRRPMGLCAEHLETDDLSVKQICAGGVLGKDTCNGDSGGPLQVPHNDARCVYDVVAITSFGVSTCGKRLPAVYVKVSYYLDWIESIVWPN